MTETTEYTSQLPKLTGDQLTGLKETQKSYCSGLLAELDRQLARVGGTTENPARAAARRGETALDQWADKPDAFEMGFE